MMRFVVLMIALIGLDNGSYTSIAVKGDSIIAVGGNDAKAFITMGRRY